MQIGIVCMLNRTQSVEKPPKDEFNPVYDRHGHRSEDRQRQGNMGDPLLLPFGPTMRYNA
jgi:hypothetical protein